MLLINKTIFSKVASDSLLKESVCIRSCFGEHMAAVLYVDQLVSVL